MLSGAGGPYAGEGWDPDLPSPFLIDILPVRKGREDVNGVFFAKTSGHDIGQGESPSTALSDAGGLPTGVPAPYAGSACAPGAAITGHAASAGDGGADGNAADANDSGLSDELASLGLRVSALEESDEATTTWKSQTDRDIDALGTRLTNAEKTASSAADGIADLNSRLTAEEKANTTQGKTLDTLTSRVTAAEKGLAAAQKDLKTLDSRLADVEADTGWLTSSRPLRTGIPTPLRP